MYRNMVEQLVVYAVRNGIDSFVKLKALKYREMRKLYPHLPSHYAYTACQDASTRAKSFLELREEGRARKDLPEVRRITIWLDDHLWRPEGYTRIKIATHRGWIPVELEPHKRYWKYINRGWKLASEAKVKLDRENRQLVVYLVFVKDVEGYEPRGFLPVDVNENNVTVLVDGLAYLLETSTRDIILGYYYRRKRIQEKYDRLYGVRSRTKRRILRKLREKHRKDDVRWKIANIIVRVAYRRHYAIVLENLGDNPAEGMIEGIKDEQLRHRVFQASFKGVQEAIVEKAREHGVPVIHVDPRNTSRTCPVHKSRITYSNGSRIGRCRKGGELWHRDVVAVWNLLFRARRARLGDGSSAPSPGGLTLDGSPMPLGSTATHEPIVVEKPLWARRNSLDATMNLHEMIGMNIQGETASIIRVLFTFPRRLGGLIGIKEVYDPSEELSKGGPREKHGRAGPGIHTGHGHL